MSYDPYTRLAPVQYEFSMKSFQPTARNLLVVHLYETSTFNSHITAQQWYNLTLTAITRILINPHLVICHLIYVILTEVLHASCTTSNYKPKFLLNKISSDFKFAEMSHHKQLTSSIIVKLYLTSAQCILCVLCHSIGFIQNHQLEPWPSDTCTYITCATSDSLTRSKIAIHTSYDISQ